MASPVINDHDNVNDNVSEHNTSIASGNLNCNNNDDNNNTDESYESYETTSTRTTATVTTTTTDKVTELNNININECDIDVLEVSLVR